MKTHTLIFSLVAVSGCWTVPAANPDPTPNKVVLRRGQTVTKTVQIEYRNPRRNVISFDTENNGGAP